MDLPPGLMKGDVNWGRVFARFAEQRDEWLKEEMADEQMKNLEAARELAQSDTFPPPVIMTAEELFGPPRLDDIRYCKVFEYLPGQWNGLYSSGQAGHWKVYDLGPHNDVNGATSHLTHIIEREETVSRPVIWEMDAQWEHASGGSFKVGTITVRT